ncbi:MAG: TraB/GumN family protein [Clostridia bacterium]|nr:TraB/GumN family protein [Clostridia bacterium]
MKIRKIMCGVLACAMLSLFTFSGCNGQNTEQSSQPSESVPSTQSSQKSENSTSKESSEPQSSENSAENEKITPSVWKVTDANGNYIYMMGSIHAADNAVNNMPDYFESAFNECTALAVEADVTNVTSDISQAVDIAQKMMYTDGTTIKDHISAETYKKSVKLLTDNNMYTSLYDYYMPFAWTSLIEDIVIEKSGLDVNKGVDTVLTKRAKKDNKKILEVESVDFQLNLFKDFSDETQELMLKAYTEDGVIEEQVKALNELYDKWKKGTITAEDVSDDVDESSMTDEEKALFDEYNKKMLDDRNINMADKAEEYMQGSETVMFVVGAAHFQGEKGILQLMKDKGCTVTPLTSDDVSDVSADENTEETYPNAA